MADEETIQQLIRNFFKIFISEDLGPVNLEQIKSLFIPEAHIIRTCGINPVVYSLDDFISPRQRLLTDGTVSKFLENEVTIRTEIFGDIAHSFVLYHKSGFLSGKQFNDYGMKTFQLVRMNQGWKICSLAWDDEREGVKVPAKYFDKG